MLNKLKLEAEITAEQFINSMNEFNDALRKLVEMYLTENEVSELHNPRTKKSRIKQLLKISNKRIAIGYMPKKH